MSFFANRKFALTIFISFSFCIKGTLCLFASEYTNTKTDSTGLYSNNPILANLDIPTALGISYSNLNSTEAHSFEARLLFENLERTYIQFDSIYTDAENLYFNGLGAHYYFLDSKNTVLAFGTAYVSGKYVESRTFAIESIHSLKSYKNLILGSKFGYASIKYNESVPFIDTDLKKGFGMLFLEYAFRERWILGIAYENRFSLDTLRLQAEYFSPIENLSFFGELQDASNDYDHAIIGLRYHFRAGTKTKTADTIDSMRKRKRSFSNLAKETLWGIGNYGALYNKNGNRYARENNLDIDFNNYGNIVENVPPPTITIIGEDEIIDSVTEP